MRYVAARAAAAICFRSATLVPSGRCSTSSGIGGTRRERSPGSELFASELHIGCTDLTGLVLPAPAAQP